MLCPQRDIQGTGSHSLSKDRTADCSATHKRGEGDRHGRHEDRDGGTDSCTIEALVFRRSVHGNPLQNHLERDRAADLVLSVPDYTPDPLHDQ